MKYLMKVRIPNDQGNDLLKDPEFGKKMQEALSEVKAEAAYFTTIDGGRGAYIVFTMDDASLVPAMVEPFFFWLKADVDIIPVMTMEDLAKGAHAIQDAYKKWGQ